MEATEITSVDSTGRRAAIAARAPDAETAAFELALAALPSRTTRVAKPRTTTILDCGDVGGNWQAAACPGGLAGFIERAWETTDASVDDVIAAGRGATDAASVLFGDDE